MIQVRPFLSALAVRPAATAVAALLCTLSALEIAIAPWLTLWVLFLVPISLAGIALGRNVALGVVLFCWLVVIFAAWLRTDGEWLLFAARQANRGLAFAFVALLSSLLGEVLRARGQSLTDILTPDEDFQHG